MESIVPKITSSIPSFIREEAPEFCQFLVDYYKYLETEGTIAELQRFQENLYGFRDDAEYIRKFLSGIGFDIGTDIDMQVDLQYKIINEFFSMRGTEPSLKLMFRLLFNEDVNVEYPRESLLYTSNANYTKNIFIITTAPDNFIMPDTTFAGVTGLTSKATATVENIDVIVASQRYLLIECSFSSDDFIVDEVIRIMTNDKNIDVVNVGAINIDVEVCGNGYKLYETVNISGCTQTGVGYISAVSSGEIESVDINKKGSGYAVGEKIRAYNGFFAEITQVDENGGIEKIKITHGGYKYKEYPELTIASANGKDAVLTPYGSKVGGVKKITFENPYTLCSENSIIGINSSSGYGFVGNLVVKGYIKNNKWTDKKGMIGINSSIIDSDEYQEFSYRIVSNVPSSKYIYYVDEHTHPYGFVRVPLMLRQFDMNMNISQQESKIAIEKEREVTTDIIINNLPESMYEGDEVELEISFETSMQKEIIYNEIT